MNYICSYFNFLLTRRYAIVMQCCGSGPRTSLLSTVSWLDWERLWACQPRPSLPLRVSPCNSNLYKSMSIGTIGIIKALHNYIVCRLNIWRDIFGVVSLLIGSIIMVLWRLSWYGGCPLLELTVCRWLLCWCKPIHVQYSTLDMRVEK